MATRKASNSISKKMPDLPTSPDDIVPYSHSAAGHEGISTSAGGSVLIKPCTQAEIDFYKSAKEDPKHEFFATHMPNFYGVVQLAPNQQQFAQLLNQQGGVAPMTAINHEEARPATPPVSKRNSLMRAPTTTSLSVKRSSGTWKPSGGKKLETGLAIALQNVAAGIQNPCILDVKLGARLWDDDAPAAKRQKLDDVAKDSTSGSLGFRVAGMRIWLGKDQASQQQSLEGLPAISQDEKHFNKDAQGEGYIGYDKFYGRLFNEGNVKDAFITYFGGTDKTGKLRRKYATTIRDRLIRELENLEWVLENEESRMYSASILIVHEGNDDLIPAAMEAEQKRKDTRDAEESTGHGGSDESGEAHADDDDEDTGSDESEDSPPKVLDVRLIDFAHARWTPGQGPDENALQGVRSVIKILKGIK